MTNPVNSQCPVAYVASKKDKKKGLDKRVDNVAWTVFNGTVVVTKGREGKYKPRKNTYSGSDVLGSIKSGSGIKTEEYPSLFELVPGNETKKENAKSQNFCYECLLC